MVERLAVDQPSWRSSAVSWRSGTLITRQPCRMPKTTKEPRKR